MNTDNEKLLDRKQSHGGDPHHPDHPHNRYKEKVKKEDTKEKHVRDPHHPDHPRQKHGN